MTGADSVVGAAAESLPLNTTISLTVTGLSKCIEIEARATLTPVPLDVGFGFGISIAFDIPVRVKVCGLGALALTENIEAKVAGPGLEYSNPRLPTLLNSVGLEAYARDELSVSVVRSAVSEGLETALASIEGSLMLVGDSIVPLEQLTGLQAIVVRLKKPLDDLPARIADVLGLAGERLALALADTDLLLEELSRITASTLPKRLARVCMGAQACIVDYAGRHVAALTDQDLVLDIVDEASAHGSVVVADVVVPPL